MTKQKGFTLIETLLALGVSSVIFMAVIFVLNFFWARANYFEGQVSSKLDLAVLEKYIFRDLNNSGPSLGNLTKQANIPAANFFEIYGENSINSISTPYRKRSLTLEANYANSVEFIVNQGRTQDVASTGLNTYYTPIYAYTYPPLAFAGLNSQKFFYQQLPSTLVGRKSLLFLLAHENQNEMWGRCLSHSVLQHPRLSDR
jgi:prepilin-type N-terminal cleavage/methylation domain-containing protein